MNENRRLLEDFDVLIVHPEKDCRNQHDSDNNIGKNTSPGKLSLPTEGTPVSRVADALAAMGAIPLRLLMQDVALAARPSRLLY